MVLLLLLADDVLDLLLDDVVLLCLADDVLDLLLALGMGTSMENECRF